MGYGEKVVLRTALLQAAIEPLPEGLPRLLPGTFSPLEAVAAIACGVDLLDTSHAVKAATEGQALLVFAQPDLSDTGAPAPRPPAQAPVQEPQPGKRVLHGSSGKAKAMRLTVAESAGRLQPASAATVASSALQADGEEPPDRELLGLPESEGDKPHTAGPAGGDVFAVAAAGQHGPPEQDGPMVLTDVRKHAPAFESMHMNLWSPVYARDRRPISEGCQCLACRQHSRAYIHHLLNTQEMLAPVLLEVHNTYEYMQLFAQVRTAIAQKRLQQLEDELKQRV